MVKWADFLSLDLRRSRDVEKRKGVFVSRPVLNFQEWKDWMDRHGVPNQVPDLHVTILYSQVDVKLPLANQPVVIDNSRWSGSMAFAMYGPDEDTLVVAFDSWELGERHCQYLCAGGVSAWPTYRPHMSLAKPPAGYELPDAALEDSPRFIVLGKEQVADIKADTKAANDDENPEGEDMACDDAIILVISIEASKAAKESYDAGAGTNPADRMALVEIANRVPITKAVAKRLAEQDWASAEIKALAGAPAAEKKVAEGAKKAVAKDVVVHLQDVRKALGDKAKDVFKSMDDERHLIWQIASVTTVGGEHLVDAHGDTFSTRAMEEFCIDLIRGQRLGKIDHEDGPANEIVQALVLSEELQKALGFDLGFEPFITCTHVPDAALWEEMKTGEWETSIAGRFTYYPDEAA